MRAQQSVSACLFDCVTFVVIVNTIRSVESCRCIKKNPPSFLFVYIQFILYSPLSQITNLPQRALQSVHIDIPVIFKKKKENHFYQRHFLVCRRRARALLSGLNFEKVLFAAEPLPPRPQ